MGVVRRLGFAGRLDAAPQIVILGLTVLCLSAAPAHAQRVRFERTFDVGRTPTLDVSTIRGSIDVIAGDDGHVVVSGEVAVRIGWDVPADAAEIARAVASAPPVQQTGDVVRAHPPDDGRARRAVTVSYRVRVPRDTRLIVATESGATALAGVSQPVVVRSQSGAITLTDLETSVRVTSGSAAISAANVRGGLEITTKSGSITGRDLGGALHVRTSSGAVNASWATPGSADVRTASSSIDLRNVAGPIAAVTSSGHVTIAGSPTAPWQIDAGSGSVELTLPRGASAALDAATRSGSVTVRGADVQGTNDKRAVRGAIGSGGPAVHVTSRSGSIRVDVGL
jgi:hypothetical protein